MTAINAPNVQVGEKLPEGICLPDLEGHVRCLDEWRGHVVVLVFWSADCPVSREYDETYFIPRYPEWQRQGIVLIGIDSNAHYDMARVREAAQARRVPYPILRDEGHRLADMLGAQTTPHVFVLDPEGRLVYAGAVDDRTFRKKQATRVYLDDALAALRDGKPPDPAVTPPYGCAIVREGSHEH